MVFAWSAATAPVKSSRSIMTQPSWWNTTRKPRIITKSWTMTTKWSTSLSANASAAMLREVDRGLSVRGPGDVQDVLWDGGCQWAARLLFPIRLHARLISCLTDHISATNFAFCLEYCTFVILLFIRETTYFIWKHAGNLCFSYVLSNAVSKPLRSCYHINR